jgi:hypothetical protein
MSSGYRRRQPWLAFRPTPNGLSVPWIRIDPLFSRSAWVPSGLSGPGGTMAGRSGSSLRIDAGGYQAGFTCFWMTSKVPTGVVQPSDPTPTGKVIGTPFFGKT